LLAERLIALEPNPRLEHVEAVDERLPGALGRKQNDGLSDSWSTTINLTGRRQLSWPVVTGAG
jgi:hypothetical protein